ncbi:MAG TPA: hypothetical protein VMH81_19305, partial [Bryobacteraceae bacterium]|nr:hypothetical protein [Bryobacteraceae bacterium]
EPAPLTSLQPLAAGPLDHLVRACMAKDPADRWSSAHDVLVQLKWLANAGSQPGMPAIAAPRRGKRERLAWIVAAVLLLAAVGGFAAYLRRTPEEKRLVSFTVNTPEGLVRASAPAVSPDGRHIVFSTTAPSELKPQLYIRDLDSLNSRPLPGTEGAFWAGAAPLFWSPDSRYVAFLADGKLKKIEIAGGPAQTLCDLGGISGGAWNREGTILFAGGDGPLRRVAATGGTPLPATVLDPSGSATRHANPQFLPDGRHFLYTAVREGDPLGVYIGDLNSKEVRQLAVGNGPVEFAQPGYLLSVTQTSLFAQAFDAERLRTTADPVLVAETGQAFISTSENGVLAYVPLGRLYNGRVEWIDRSGKEAGAISEAGVYFQPVVSPDGSRIAVDRRDVPGGVSDIWLLDPIRQTASRFTFGPNSNAYPMWSPDGTRVAYSAYRGGQWSLAIKPANGVGDPVTLCQSPHLMRITDWSPDGRFLIYEAVRPQTRGDLWLLPLGGDHKPVPYLVTSFNETAARFSPDGKLVAYTSNESGREEIYVQTFPPGAGKWQISNAGGNRAVWRRDSKELFYTSLDRQMMGVEVLAGPRFSVGLPRVLFAAQMALPARYDVASDRRFLMVKALRDDVTSPITVILNWPSAIKR